MKDRLRYKYKIKRKYFQHSAREVADGAIADAILQAFADKHSFFVYYSYGAEADTHGLISRLLAAGKEVYLPRVEGKAIVPVKYDGDENALMPNRYGINEPAGQAFDGAIDVCVTPLLAVNSRGFRLGYGGGFYDRYFAANPDIIRAGLGYFLQLTDELEEEELDEPLDLFVCERGIISFERRDIR
ncbi:MAG: 5-formyltetrahydrofolate cyclo-ligase [Clostridia bacterium]|nr:5-formyltetrahydrofolate cyclo-ligase [Clostridia bacterium]